MIAAPAIAPPEQQQAPEDRGTGTGPQVTTGGGGNCPARTVAQCHARVSIDVYPDEIVETVRLTMGQHNDTISRRWKRVGNNSFQSRAPDWSAHEERVGSEIVDFMSGLDLPTRIANMLPRTRGNPNAAAEAVALLADTHSYDQGERAYVAQVANDAGLPLGEIGGGK